MATRILRPNEAGPSGVERDLRRRELASRERRELLDPVAAGRESIRQFAGHGDDVKVGDPNSCFRLREGLRQPLETEAERRRDLDRVDDAAVLRARGLEVGSAHVPSDDGAHVPIRALPVLISLEHDPEKWVPVFRKDHAQTKS